MKWKHILSTSEVDYSTVLYCSDDAKAIRRSTSMIDSVPRSLSNFRSSRHVYVGPYPDTCTLVFAATSVCSQRPDTPCNSVILSVNTTSKYVLSSYTRKLRLRRAASRSRKRGGYSFATFFLVPSCCPSDTVASLKLATVYS
jgi:hypothetical protein